MGQGEASLKKATRATATVDPLFESYRQLATSLLGDLSGVCLLDAKLQSNGETSGVSAAAIGAWLSRRGWNLEQALSPEGMAPSQGQWLTAIPLQQLDGPLLGVFCVQQSLPRAPTQPSRHGTDLAQRLKPLLDCVHRDLASAVPVHKQMQTLTERTAELEWLFKVTGRLKGGTDDRRMAEELLLVATERLKCELGVLAIPEKRLTLASGRKTLVAKTLRTVWKQTAPKILAWTQRHASPLLLNNAGTDQTIARCKILAVPVVRDTGRVLGVLAFFNGEDAPDFAARHVFLARHLGREAAAIVDAQFDLMTGLYTRGGLEQMFTSMKEDADAPDASIVYIDVDHMHVVNELHGFELGNELIVRIADILGPPLLPDTALAARISGDRFAVILRETRPEDAAGLAANIQAAARRLVIGPPKAPVDVSISCGVAALVVMPQGLGRALAAAELACKTGKARGPNRVEIYANEDGSMMRQHDNAIAVGQLRAALKNDRLMLYAQRIVPLQNRALPGGYELLLRLKGDDGEPLAPGALLQAAQRYQLMPSVDRWVMQRALQLLVPYRAMLRSRGISISINMSGQSIDDESSVRQFREQIHAANLPPSCLTIEITEQAAVKSLARANEMIRQFEAIGCRFALDDFGTGANTFTYVKSLSIARVKIDGSFVKDILSNRNSQATVHAIVELAKSLSLETVAEYVEDESVAAEVRRLGVDYAQGYAFGKPVPLEGLLTELSDDESRRLHRLFLET
jgi:diguanylate cyclase (GGDEF)-like protein